MDTHPTGGPTRPVPRRRCSPRWSARASGLTGFVVTVGVLIVQMATGTFSARYMRIFYRDRLLKAVLAVLVGTLTFSYGLLGGWSRPPCRASA